MIQVDIIKFDIERNSMFHSLDVPFVLVKVCPLVNRVIEIFDVATIAELVINIQLHPFFLHIISMLSKCFTTIVKGEYQ